MATPLLQARTSRIWHSYLLLFIFGILATVWLTPSLACALLLLALDNRLRRPRLCLTGVALFIIAFCYGHYHFLQARDEMRALPDWATYAGKGKTPRLAGTITSVRRLPDNKLLIHLSDLHSPKEPHIQPLRGICVWLWQNPPEKTDPKPGQIATFDASLRFATTFNNTDAGNYANLAKGIYWRASTSGVRGNPHISGEAGLLSGMRAHLRQKFLMALADEEPQQYLTQAKAILLALIFGDRGALARETVDNFSAAAIAHSLALSGQHLCIAALFGILLAALIAKIHPAIYLFYPRPVLAALASLPFTLLYLWIGGAPASLVRAAIMLCIFSLWIWRSGTFKGTDILCAAIAIILLANPLSILDTGLQLSVLCVSVIMLMAQTINKIRLPNWISPPKIRTITTNLLKILAVSFAIQLFLLPVLLSRFGIAGAWFPVNALWLPVLGLVVLPFAMLGLFFCSLPWTWSFFLAKFCLNIASIPCAALVNLLSELSTSGLLDEPVFMKPHWSLFPAFALLIVLFILAWQSAKNLTAMPAKKNIAIGCLVLLAIAPCLRLMDALDYRLGLYTLDVGQGQAIALKYAPGSILLLDGGGMNPSSFDIGRNVVAPCLTDNAMPHKISLLNTHPDYDHLGGLFWIAEKFQPLYFFHNGHEAIESINGQWKTLRTKGNAPTLYAGDVIILGDPERDLRLEVLHPPAGDHAGAPEPDAAWHGNAASLILRLARGNEGLALFTGDASKNAQTFILDDNGNYQAEVVFAPHHGSDHNLLPALYEASNPKLVIVNCGSQNHWKFPGRKLLAYLKRKKINELDTGRNGRIDIAFAEDNTFSVDTIKNQPHNFIRAAKRDRNAKDKFGGDYFSTE